jgi:hypothetical protein
MAAERKRVWGELAAWHLAGVVGHMPFVNATLRPQEINPYRPRAGISPRLAAARAFVAEVAFKAMMSASRKE